MHYDGTIIRPPSEADSIIFQVTAGCSHNGCTFCGAYKDKPFRFRLETVDEDIAFAQRHCRGLSKVFLADGDALILPYRLLRPILEKIRGSLPWVRKISLYATCRAIRSKSEAQLRELKALGLKRIYLGLESGHDAVLERIGKKETAASMEEAAAKVRRCGLFLSVTHLLGIAGREMSAAHAAATGEVLSAMQPRQVAALTVMPLPGTPFFEEVRRGDLTLPSPAGLLRELRTVIECIQCEKVQFYANHASNYLHLSGRLRRDRDLLLRRIDDALDGEIELVREGMRAL